MATSPESTMGQHVLDSGPLFCLGASGIIADIYDELYLSRATTVEAVRNEVVRKSEIRVPPGDPYRDATIKGAAQKARGRYWNLLDAAVVRPTPPTDDLQAIEASLLVLAEIKARRNGKTVHPDANKGEAEALHEAELSAAILVTNDDDAHTVTRQRGKATAETFVGLVRHLARERQSPSRRQLANEVMRLDQSGVQVGGYVSGPNDLA